MLPGLQLHALETDVTATFAFCLTRTVDEEGRVGWCYRTSAAPNREELLGALMVRTAILKNELTAEWE